MEATHAITADTIWNTPHPLAYAYRASKDISFLKSLMKDYCHSIQQVKLESDVIGRKLFSKLKRAPKKKTLDRRIKYLESLEQEEQQYRSGFQLARCLWQLERTMVETYVALTKWQRSTTMIEKLLETDPRCCTCHCNATGNNNGNDNDNESCQSYQKFLELLQREEEESQNKYEQCGFEQAVLSKEIASYLGIDHLNPTKSVPITCDDFMVGYTLKHYCQCSGCIFFFNRKDLGLFGRFRVCLNCNCDSSSSSSSSSNNNANNPCVGSFYCLECYESILNEEDEQKTSTTDCIGRGAAASSRSDGSCNSNAKEPKPLLSNNKSKSNGTAGKKRRKKKKKKKATTPQSSLRSGSSSEKTEGRDAAITSCCSRVSGVLECTTNGKEEENEDEQRDNEMSCPVISKESNNLLGNNEHSIHESCPDSSTITTSGSFSSSSSSAIITHDFLDGIHDDANEYRQTTKTSSESNVNDDNSNDNNDPNELWVEYLWKTGSMIALDRYMDEMEETLGNEYDCA